MFEAYSVGIKISLINGVSAGLSLIGRQFRTAHTDVAALEKRLLAVRTLLVTGAGMAAVGGGLLYLIGKTIKPASEYAHELQLLNTSGMKHLEIVNAINASWAAMKEVPTSTLAQNMQAIRELRMVFRGNTQEAIQFMPAVQKLEMVLANLRGGNPKEDAYTIAKALELKGAVKNPAQFLREANMMTQAMVASGGKLGPQDFLQNFVYSRGIAQYWSDQFAYRIFPTLMQETKAGGSGGARGVGNALMSAFQAVVTGAIPQKSLGVWEKLGLLDPHKEIWNRVGSLKGIKPGGVKGSDLFQTDPYAWVQTNLMPALKGHGITDEKRLQETIRYLFPNRTAGFAISQMGLQAWKFQGDAKVIAKAMGLDAYNTLLQNDPQAAAMALQARWNDLMSQLGFVIMPDLIDLMKSLIPLLTKATIWVKDNGHTVKRWMEAIAAVSGLLVAGGVINAVLAFAKAIKGIGIATGLLGAGGAGGAAGGGAAGGVAGGAAAGAAARRAALGRLGLWAAIFGVTSSFMPYDPKNPEWVKEQNRARQMHSPFWYLFNHDDKQQNSGSPFVPQKQSQSSGPGNVYLDGDLVGSHVTRKQVKAMSLPHDSVTYFDATMFPTPVAGGAW